MTRYLPAIAIILLFIGLFILFNPLGKSSDWMSKEITFNKFENWIDYTSPTGFSVKFPNEPENTTQSMEDQVTGEKRQYDLYVSETLEGKVFMVSIITFSEEAHQLKDQELMRRIIIEILERKEDNSLEKIDVSTIHSLPAIDFTIRGTQSLLEGTVFMDQRKLYLLTEIAPVGGDTDEFNYFRNSFSLGGK